MCLGCFCEGILATGADLRGGGGGGGHNFWVSIICSYIIVRSKI